MGRDLLLPLLRKPTEAYSVIVVFDVDITNRSAARSYFVLRPF